MASGNPAADEGPGVRIPPPLVAFSSAAAGAALERFRPLAAALPRPLRIGGAALAAAALLLAATGLAQFIRARTTVRPDRAPTSLLKRGPYRFSRNPLYVSLVLLQAGLGLAFGSLWVAILALATAAILARLVIAKEERYLADRFGDSYREYASRVRRWI